MQSSPQTCAAPPLLWQEVLTIHVNKVGLSHGPRAGEDFGSKAKDSTAGGKRISSLPVLITATADEGR